jgi:hypothetical protein
VISVVPAGKVKIMKNLLKFNSYLVHAYNLMNFKLSLIADLLMQLQNMLSRLLVTHYELR